MKPFYIELIEEPHIYIRDGKPLFGGTPDRVLRFPKQSLTILIDRKFGRNEVPTADVNMQLRAYLTMTPAAELEFGLPPGYSEEFRPSSMLRIKLCPGSLALERQMRSQGLSDDEPTEYAEEGRRLHKAMAEPLAPREHLTPEQIETVEKAERMEREFLDFVLNCELPVQGEAPYWGAVVQPRTSKKADMAFYTNDDIIKAKIEIDGIWDKAHQEGAPRNASPDACCFCPCKALCPEYKSWLLAVEKIQHLPAAQWSVDQWEVFLTRRRELQKFLDERYEDAKRIAATIPDAIPGWELEPGDNVRHVADIVAAWAALSDVISAKEFSESCKIVLGAIEETIWRARKDTPGKVTQKEAKTIVNSKLANLIELKQKAPSLVRKKT